MIDVVCGIIVNAAGHFLACQRPPGKHLAGLWEFPGGKVNPGETPPIALARELLEELAVEVQVEHALTPVIWTYGEKTIRLFPYRCTILAGEITALEHAALAWMSSQNFQDFVWAEADLPILAEILSAENPL